MNTFEYTMWLATQVYSALAHLWIVSLSFVVFGFISIVWLALKRPMRSSTSIALVASLLGPILLLLYGGIFRANNFDWFGPRVAEFLLVGISLCIVVAFVVAILLSHTNRLATVGIVMIGAWLSFWSFFVSVMAVTGDWL